MKRVLQAAAVVSSMVLISGCGGASSQRATTASTAIECAAPSTPPNNTDLIPNSQTAGLVLTGHFADRYVLAWSTTPQQPDGSDQRIVVAVTSPTSEDTAFVRSIPDIGDRIVVVPSPYSAAQLSEFQSKLGSLMTGNFSSDEPRVVSTGQQVRDDNFTETGSPVIGVGVTACDPTLIDRIAALVPADSVQIRIQSPAVAG